MVRRWFGILKHRWAISGLIRPTADDQDLRIQIDTAMHGLGVVIGFSGTMLHRVIQPFRCFIL